MWCRLSIMNIMSFHFTKWDSSKLRSESKNEFTFVVSKTAAVTAVHSKDSCSCKDPLFWLINIFNLSMKHGTLCNVKPVPSGSYYVIHNTCAMMKFSAPGSRKTVKTFSSVSALYGKKFTNNHLINKQLRI